MLLTHDRPVVYEYIFTYSYISYLFFIHSVGTVLLFVHFVLVEHTICSYRYTLPYTHLYIVLVQLVSSLSPFFSYSGLVNIFMISCAASCSFWRFIRLALRTALRILSAVNPL